MLYFLWQMRRFTNQKISELFGLSYTSVGKRVGIVRKKLVDDKTFKERCDEISMIIEIMTPIFQRHRLPVDDIRVH